MIGAFLLNGCDDGDLVVDSIDFTDVKAESCNTIVYKMKDSEVLLLDIPNGLPFANVPTLPDAPRTFPINTTNRVIYRGYDGVITLNSFCTPIPPATPIVNEEWIGTDGTIEIVTVPMYLDNTDPDFVGGKKLTKFVHTIRFLNITFQKPNGPQLEAVHKFGNYDTAATNLLFGFDENVEKCAANNLVYNIAGRELITLAIDPALIANVETLGTPRTGLLGTTTNKLTYTLFNNDGDLESSYVCATATPAIPTALETWDGVNGVSGISGIVEVKTTVSAGVYQHEIRLKNATLQRGSLSFKIADDYLLGTLLSN